MKIIVGLGNPGVEYADTHHNVGFLVLDKIANKYSEKFSKDMCHSKVCLFHVGDEKIILVKPQTFMNNSGIAVSEIVNKYKINTEHELMVISDDVDITEGTIRIRKESNSSTHNGIKSIVQYLGTNKFMRLKVSICPRPEFGTLTDHVLGKIRNKCVYDAIDSAADAVLEFIDGKDINYITNKYSK